MADGAARCRSENPVAGDMTRGPADDGSGPASGLRRARQSGCKRQGERRWNEEEFHDVLPSVVSLAVQRAACRNDPKPRDRLRFAAQCGSGRPGHGAE